MNEEQRKRNDTSSDNSEINDYQRCGGKTVGRETNCDEARQAILRHNLEITDIIKMICVK